MIAVLGSVKSVVGLRLYDTSTSEIKDVAYNQVLEAYKQREDDKKVVENLDISSSGSELVGSNGKIDRYTLIKMDRVSVIGKAPLVVLRKMLNGDYIVIDYKGVVARMTKEQVVDYASTEGIANGKIVYGEEPYVSSISGEYDEEIAADGKAASEKLNAVNALMGLNKFKLDEGGNFYIVDKKITGQLIIPAGTVGIKEYGCLNCTGITEVVIPSGLERLGLGAFKGCNKIERVLWKEPSKVETIQADTFSGCVSLKSIDIASSVRAIESGAFMSCRKLKLVITGKISPDIEYGAIPRGVNIKKR